MLLCIVTICSLCGITILSIAQALDFSADASPQEETAADIRLRLLRKIRSGWDPYSEDMTLDEFYVLMEMFEDGTLPLKNVATFASVNSQNATAASSENIPREMFLFAGLSGVSFGDDTPLPYDTDTGAPDERIDYPAGLDPYRAGYQRPPKSWSGVETVGMQALIVKKGVNDNNFAIAGDVIQERFLSYDGYYVKQVMVEGIDAAILGVVQKPDGGYVYYYLSAEGQSSTVSTTTMALGGKFIVQYAPNERRIQYKVYENTDKSYDNWDSLENFLDFKEITDDAVGLAGYTDTWVDSIFGASRPLRTTDGAYAFDVSTPYEYEVRLYRQKGDEIGQYTGKTPLAGYDLVNDGYPLGAEPVYELVGAKKKLLPNTDKGPSAMKTNVTLYNNFVTEDRTVIAVVTKKDAPKFDAYRLLPSIENTSGRGTSAWVEIKAKLKGTNTEVTIPYDYEDLYLWANGGNSKYDYYDNNSSLGGASKENIRVGNIATADRWGWNTKYDGISDAYMKPNDDGTYSYQWTWQTNDGDAFLLDTLEINGVGISIPYFPKDSIHGNTKKAGTQTGIKGYYTESTLPDGAVVKVEMLMAFAGRPQRVYRITVTGARTNVTLTNMNLFMFGSGAPEVAVYALEGVYSGVDANNQSPSIQYFNNGWIIGELADVLVESPGEGIQYNVENDFHGANIRFKLADGYGNPYYLFEDPYSDGTTVLDGQASADRNLDDLTVTPNLNRIRKMSELGETEKLDPHYIYEGADGWYYIRLTGHTPKVALLTIGAIQIRYVVHYIPETTDVPAPQNMPRFTHTDACPTFVTGSPLMHEYDDNAGLFYDTFKNNMVAIPSDSSGILQPTDQNEEYIFVDWVLVDENGQPITAEGKEFHFFSQAIDITTIDQYTVFNNELGGDAVDIYVIRLKPTWKKITKPFKYNIVLNWVDAQGVLHKENFKGNWDEVLTESPVDGESLYVYVNQLAEPFWDWIAQHPTYAFWDAVNNASDEGGTPSEVKIREALSAYLSGVALSPDELANLLNEITALSNGNGQIFIRLGSNTFAVNVTGGEISLWMYEDKGGLVFKKDVQKESFLPDEEFYFTVTDVTTADGHNKLNGNYKAYPKKVLDSEGNDTTTNADAWDVTFENGNIVSIVKNGKNYGKYFTLKHDEEIRLYIPEGTYTIVELGSSSGGTYKVEVEYTGKTPQSGSWELPSNNQWLQGSRKEVTNSVSGVSQVTAKVDFKVGEQNVVQTIIFHNQTSSISIEKELDSFYGDKKKIPDILFSRYYTFYVTLKLPENYSPLTGTRPNGTSYYYFHMNISGREGTIELEQEEDGRWKGEFQMKAGERAVIVMTVPETENTDINYWVYEDQTGFDTDYDDILTAIYTDNEGKAVPAACAKVIVTNRYGGVGYLVITEADGDPNDSFLYRITDKDGNELIVSVKGGGKTIVYAPCGNYTIEEISNWSWRYEDGVCAQSTDASNRKKATVRITGKNDTPDHAVHADYTHERKDTGWLGGESSEENRFSPPPTPGEGEE